MVEAVTHDFIAAAAAYKVVVLSKVLFLLFIHISSPHTHYIYIDLSIYLSLSLYLSIFVCVCQGYSQRSLVIVDSFCWNAAVDSIAVVISDCLVDSLPDLDRCFCRQSIVIMEHCLRLGQSRSS